MNIKITNMDNESKIIISEKDFATCKNLLSENSVYEETDEPITKEVNNDAKKLNDYIAAMYRRQHEIN